MWMKRIKIPFSVNRFLVHYPSLNTSTSEPCSALMCECFIYWRCFWQSYTTGWVNSAKALLVMVRMVGMVPLLCTPVRKQLLTQPPCNKNLHFTGISVLGGLDLVKLSGEKLLYDAINHSFLHYTKRTHRFTPFPSSLCSVSPQVFLPLCSSVSEI